MRGGVHPRGRGVGGAVQVGQQVRDACILVQVAKGAVLELRDPVQTFSSSIARCLDTVGLSRKLCKPVTAELKQAHHSQNSELHARFSSLQLKTAWLKQL